MEQRFQKAFDELKLAFLDQELALRQYANQSHEHERELWAIIEELATSVDERLKRLEEDRHPAA